MLLRILLWCLVVTSAVRQHTTHEKLSTHVAQASASKGGVVREVGCCERNYFSKWNSEGPTECRDNVPRTGDGGCLAGGGGREKYKWYEGAVCSKEVDEDSGESLDIGCVDPEEEFG